MAAVVEFQEMKLKLDKDERVLFAHFDSSSIAAIAYNVEDKSLYVLFQHDLQKRYCYVDVPVAEFLKIISADSVGAALVKFKKAGYDYFDEPNK